MLISRPVKIATAHTAHSFFFFNSNVVSILPISNPGVWHRNWGNTNITVEHPGNLETEFGSEYSHFSRTFMSLSCWEELPPIGMIEGIEVSLPDWTFTEHKNISAGEQRLIKSPGSCKDHGDNQQQNWRNNSYMEYKYRKFREINSSKRHPLTGISWHKTPNQAILTVTGR